MGQVTEIAVLFPSRARPRYAATMRTQPTPALLALLALCSLDALTGCQDPEGSAESESGSETQATDSGPGTASDTESSASATDTDSSDTNTSESSGESCGDGVCDPDEDCESCEADCGPCVPPEPTECNDGIDNDNDGLIDWQYDVGCWSAEDGTEASRPRDEENGYTTFDLSSDSQIIYVSSSEGDDANDGLTPETAVATPAQGAALIRDGFADFLLFKRGDSWRGQDIGANSVERRFKSGPDAAHPIVIGSYGDSSERPRLEIDKAFVDDDGNERSNLAVVGLALISYPKVPGDPEFNGADGGALRFVGTGQNILIEDNYVEYGEFIVQNLSEVELRHNVVYRSYHVGTCAEGDPNGDPTFRPSGIFAGRVQGLLIEGNTWDENGWNPEVPEACATIYNHNLYLSGCSDLTVRDNLILRASSIGIKMASSEPGGSVNVEIADNVFAEGEIGVSMGGNADTAGRFVSTSVHDNVFTDIGRSQPTGRELSWYIDLLDNDGAQIYNNLLVNQPPLGNPYGVHLGGGSNDSLIVENNRMFGLQRRLLLIDVGPAYDGLYVFSNTMVASAEQSCVVDYDGPFGPIEFMGNRYLSPASPEAWFCVDGAQLDLAGWEGASGELGASEAEAWGGEVRNLDTYAEMLGYEPSLAAFAEQARTQSRHTFRAELRADEVAAYISAGYPE